MDDIEALFGRARPAAGVPSAQGVREHEVPTHVLIGTDDDDLLDTKDGDGLSLFSVDEPGPSLSRSASTAKAQNTIFDADGWDYADEVPLRPMGSSKTIIADDEPDPPVRAALRTAAPHSARAPRAPPSSLLTLLLADARWQLGSLRHRVQQEIRRLRTGAAPAANRRIVLNDAAANKNDDYSTNQVMSNKYNVLTFVPVFLWEQFSKYANLFFLFIGCLQQIPGVSPTNRWTTLVPLAIVLLVAAAKELSEDWQRYKGDVEMNSRLVQVLENGSWTQRPWRAVRVGDVVRLERDAFFPADLLLLASSEPEGLAYVETANLDGETNLKVKQASPATAALVSAETVGTLRGHLACEAPNNSLYTFDGTLHLEGRPPVPVGPDQVLLRGAQLRNAPWVFGLVLFTGHDTKLLRNATKTPIKRTRVDKQVNSLILSLFVLLLALALISSIGSMAYENSAPSYLMPQLDGRSRARKYIESVLTYIILYNSLIPISLIVSMDVVKFQQAALINSDLEMYHEATDTPALCRRSNLVEDLGQVEYLFSDKTGTLTCNDMQFRQASISGVTFADKRSEAPGDDKRAWGELPDLRAAGGPLADAVERFLTVLAVCHTVIPEVEDGRVVFQASSPDEAALVAGAQALGYEFTTRKPRSVYVRVHGVEREYQVLQVCEFNSARKRMSTVVREPSGRIYIYCKGADTVMLPRLAAKQECLDATLSHLEAYAAEGLRTLCIAARELPAAEYERWARVYDEAAARIDGRAAALDAAAAEIETGFQLLGATAIEDRLQDGVPETIATLQTAGIKVWVLTGDRQETAINIGYSCRLISESMSLLIVNESTAADTAAVLSEQRATIDAHPEAVDDLALVIEGRSLQHALQESLAPSFLRLASACRAVICCRVSPLQKALVVELVKAHTDSILLAIGDGANDVGMIQAAHVGVGISGNEGLQAARSADVAISQFRFLRKLLLVHGTWNYARLSKMVLYSFYKTVTLYVTLFWFSFYNGFSGQTAYESWSQSFYNVAFTMLPTLVIGIFDQYVSASMLERYPQLYRPSFFTGRAIGAWMLNAVYHSMINFFMVTYAFYDHAIERSGFTPYQWLWGTAMYLTVLGTVLGKAALVSNLWTRYTLLAIPGSLALTLAFLVVFGTVAPALGVSLE